MSNMKTYRRKDGYTIKATEKAYNLFYKKQGFVEVKENKAAAKKAVEAEANTEDPAEVNEKEPAEKTDNEAAAPDSSKEAPKGSKKKKAE